MKQGQQGKAVQGNQDYLRREISAKAERAKAFSKGNIKQRPVKEVWYPDALGKRSAAFAVKNTLDFMYERGNIDQWQYQAGQVFAHEFERCGYGHVSGVNLSGASGCGMDVEEIYSRSKKSRDYVHNVIQMLGGPQAYLAITVVQVIGHQVGLRDMTEWATDSAGSKKHRQFWSGILISALQIMGDDYRRMCCGKRSRGKFEASVSEYPTKMP